MWQLSGGMAHSAARSLSTNDETGSHGGAADAPLEAQAQNEGPGGSRLSTDALGTGRAGVGGRCGSGLCNEDDRSSATTRSSMASSFRRG
jgi:hypothetical protein